MKSKGEKRSHGVLFGEAVAELERNGMLEAANAIGLFGRMMATVPPGELDQVLVEIAAEASAELEDPDAGDPDPVVSVVDDEGTETPLELGPDAAAAAAAGRPDA